MANWFGGLMRRLRGERRARPRVNGEKVEVTNRVYAVGVKAARKLHTTPEELLGYRHADHILAKGRR